MTRSTFAGPLLGCLSLLLLSPGALDAQETKLERTIHVSGVGKISAAPDVADITLGVSTDAGTASDALRANSEAMKAVQDVAKGSGVAAKDIQTSNLSVQPRYSQPVPGVQQRGEFVPRIIGYNVSNNVQITSRDLAKLGELLDAVVSSGANQMNGISFRIEKSEALMDQARKLAVADARRKAELLAGEAGVVLGKPIQISESSDAIPMPYPMMRGEMAMMAAAPSVPISSGELDLSVSVQVVYELKDAE